MIITFAHSRVILYYTSKFNYFEYIYIYMELVGHGIFDFDCLLSVDIKRFPTAEAFDLGHVML